MNNNHLLQVQNNTSPVYILNTDYVYGKGGYLNSIENTRASGSGNSAASLQKDHRTSFGGIQILSDIINGHNNNNSNNNNNNNNNNLPYGGTICNTTTASSASGQTKKGSAIKSTIIAKKTKFWKYLEEEKRKKNCLDNFTSDDKKYDRIRLTTTNEPSNSGTNKTILDCTLCDNCRCLDCQSRYFECDDESYDSEFLDSPNSMETDDDEQFYYTNIIQKYLKT